MQILKSNFKVGLVQIRITDADDLWYLSHIIDPGDFIKGKTTRKVKIGDSENAKVAKKTLTLKIEAETVDFGDGSKLRINGKVNEPTADIPKDSYHSISLEVGSDFSIQKSSWLAYQKQKLKEASEEKHDYLICILDREEVLFALTKKNGFKILTKIKGQVPKKNKTNEVKKDFKEEIIKALETYEARLQPKAVILASPAFYKDDVLKKIKDQKLKSKIVLATCSDISEAALDEVIKRPELKEVLKSSRSREEKLLVDELLSEINKKNLATYGHDEVLKAIDAGAVSKLLITDKFIKAKKEEKEYSELDEKMKNVDSLQGEIHIISSDEEGGKKLDGLGGIAAILRYKLN